eukprot:COSAG05_NODE_974_length_6359_cov_3.906869_6_plen_134_part_00
MAKAHVRASRDFACITPPPRQKISSPRSGSSPRSPAASFGSPPAAARRSDDKVSQRLASAMKRLDAAEMAARQVLDPHVSKMAQGMEVAFEARAQTKASEAEAFKARIASVSTIGLDLVHPVVQLYATLLAWR